MSLHLGILQTDHVLEEFQTAHGDYTDMFHRLFSSVDADIRFSDYDVQVAVPPDTECDAYVITGSKNSVYEDLPWIPPLVNYLKQVLADRKKIIGICFGHQLMAHYFGGQVAAAEQGWGVGVHHTDVVQTYPWMTPALSEVGLLCSHKDQVKVLPDDAELFLAGDFCPLAGFIMGDQVITVQGHPEFQKPYSNDLMDKRRSLLGEAVYQSGKQSLTEETHEGEFARWLLEFVRAS